MGEWTDFTEWTYCINCIYSDECQHKEDRDGCYLGEGEEN